MSRISKRRSANAAEVDSSYGQKRDEIRRAAARVFLRLGYSATKISDIASEAGIDRATLYYYYSSKEELFQELSTRLMSDHIDAITELANATSLSPSEKLTKAIELVMTSFEADPHLYVLMSEDVLRWRATDREGDDWFSQVHEWSRTYFNLLRRIINDGIASDEFASPLPSGVLAHCVVGILNYSHAWFQPGGVLSAAEVATGMSKLILAGLSSDGRRQATAQAARPEKSGARRAGEADRNSPSVQRNRRRRAGGQAH
jgi:TetR/AcrR family transcriptional regulator, cholesterol catabolism regulator